MFQSYLGRCVAVLLLLVIVLGITPYALAADVNPYIKRYFKAAEPVSIALNDQGQTREFSAEAFSDGMRLFEENCINCHVGGATLPNPLVSLSLEDLAQATPPRNTIRSLVAFQREPLSYDGTEIGYGCREVTENWMSDEELEQLAAFILRAAEVAPGWGASQF